MIGYITWNIDPEIINLFGLISIRYYGVFFITGLLLGYYIVKQIFNGENIGIENLDTLTVYIFIGTIIGARLGHCLFYEPEYFLRNPLEIILPFTWKIGDHFEFTGYRGLASHGGAIGVLLATLIYCRKKHFNFLWVLDRVAIATPVTGAFIRLGNFMNSEIIGNPTNSNFGVVFQKVDLLPRHPAQLYEAIAYILIFLILLWTFNKLKKSNNDGYIFGLFLVLLFTIRFVIEFFKINQVEFESEMLLNVGQLLSIPFIIMGIGLMIWKGKRL
ncbi:MAG: prolipoprotein diacylglyceryl transferase [Bacteroidetes bacterium GWF2_33_16]|nr:MAG: prolipoprotein diacylglyceryl transferase [Bacteroidetes bacterium GWE2_32_14]OFY03183.1 MAG: prolipoprotein diacylglyceryl transferase [Bacteroidetes bacterium GWF2_33_16]